MKKFFKTLLSAAAVGFTLFSFNASAAVDMTDPYKMVDALAQKTFSDLKANKDKLNDVAFRKQLIREDLMPYVDTAYAAYSVMGQYAKNATKEERSAFTEAFGEYIVATYADALGKYNNQELVSPAYEQVGAKETMVSTKFLIREPQKQDLEVVFKLRKNSKTGEWKAFDMVAEGISMLSAKQSELTPLIRTKGVAGVTSLLKEHNESLNTAPIGQTK